MYVSMSIINASSLKRKDFLYKSKGNSFVLTGKYLADLNRGIATRVRDKEASNAEGQELAAKAKFG